MRSKERPSGNRKNVVLAGLLDELGWSHTRMMREINGFLGAGYMGRSSVAEWVTNGRTPREPLPSVVAHLLSHAVGRKISVCDLWGRRARESEFWIPADHGQPLTWDYSGVLSAAHDWTSNIGRAMDTDRRRFMAISGTALTGMAWIYLDTPAQAVTNSPERARDAIKITPAIMDTLETTISGLRKLDDAEGGNLNTLRIAHHHFSNVAQYVKSANTVGQATHQRLLDAWANLCHTAGWMAVDAQEHGLAQRYYLTGLQVTKTTGNDELAAHFLGALAQHAAHRGDGRDAVELADAAVEAAKGGRAVVRSLIWSRTAEAQAVAGNAYASQSAADKARDLFGGNTTGTDTPEWAYWYNKAALEARSGWTGLLLAKNKPRKNDSIFDAADKMLTPHVQADTDFPRDHLVNASWLARSYVWRGELDQAVSVGGECLQMLGKVHSPRAAGLLKEFTSELKQHRGARGNRQVRELVAGLR